MSQFSCFFFIFSTGSPNIKQYLLWMAYFYGKLLAVWRESTHSFACCILFLFSKAMVWDVLLELWIIVLYFEMYAFSLSFTFMLISCYFCFFLQPHRISSAENYHLLKKKGNLPISTAIHILVCIRDKWIFARFFFFAFVLKFTKELNKVMSERV